MSHASEKPKTIEALAEYVQRQVEADHDYNTSAEAALDVACAAFNYAASAMGLSGFQASYAALSFIGRVNGYTGPYGFIKAEDALFPQYDVAGKAAEMIEGWQPWLKEQAVKHLNESQERGEEPHPRVYIHWLKLAGDDAPGGILSGAQVSERFEDRMTKIRTERLPDA